MTQDEIFEMAKKAHLGVTLTHDGIPNQFIEGACWTEELEAFAKLVAEREREACAKLAELSKAEFTALAIRARQ